MSQRHSDSSNQILQRPTSSEYPPYTGDRSDSSRNLNGKRSGDDLWVDQVETPRKIVRLDGDHYEREEPQQPSNPPPDTSNPKQKQEFVDGPGHIVFIDERGKRCPAICFNKMLLSTFNHIAVTTREVRERHEEIQNAQVEFEKIKSSNQPAGLEQAKRAVEKAVEILEDIEAGIPGLVEARRRCDGLEQKNKWSSLLLDSSKRIAQYVVEQILNRENLLDPPAYKPQEPVEVDKNHSAKAEPVSENIVQNIQNSNMPESSVVSSTTRSQSSIDIEEQLTPRQLALRHLRFAAGELEFRRRQLALMQEEHSQGVAADRFYPQEQYPDRPASTTQTDVDLTSLQTKQQFTRDVIEAEEAYDRAEQHAEALGLGDILADPHACYWGETRNEFPPRIPESPSMFPVDRSRIETWMDSVPTVVDPRRLEDAESVETDDWEAKSVEIFDSVSTFASDSYRKKIDKWQELSRRSRENHGDGPSRNVRRNPRRGCRGRQFPT